MGTTPELQKMYERFGADWPREDLLELADQIERARVLYLNQFGTPNAEPLRNAFAQLLWDNKGTFASALRAAALAATPAEDSSDALTGADLGRWCYENPNLAALTIEGLRAGTPAVGGDDPVAWRWKYREAPNMDWICQNTDPGQDYILAEPLYTAPPASQPAVGGEAAAELVQRFEMESMALHKTQREWLVREIGKVLAAPPASQPAVGGEALKEALERYSNCRDDRPLVYTMVPGDPLTVGDLRRAYAAAQPAYQHGGEREALATYLNNRGIDNESGGNSGPWVFIKPEKRDEIVAILRTAAPPASPLRGREEADCEDIAQTLCATNGDGFLEDCDATGQEAYRIRARDLLARYHVEFRAASPPEQPAAVKMYRDTLDAANKRITELEDRLSKAAFVTPSQSQ